MRFLLLGPLEVRSDGGVVAIGALQRRILLATLLLHANEVVSVDRLIDLLWGEATPQDPAAGLQVRVHQLRRLLEPGRVGSAASRLRTQPPGYRLEVHPGELDLELFQQRVREGLQARASGRSRAAADAYRDALALWRGSTLADIPDVAMRFPEVAALEEQRLAVLEDRIDAELACGRHAELVGELTARVADHPLRERLCEQLLLALYRAGRQADALAAYRRVREALTTELGITPGPSLQRLQRLILTNDPSLDWAEAPAVAAPGTGAPRPPSELPADVDDFTGRDELVAEVERLLVARDGTPASPRVVSVSGKPGVGKTAFAIHLAHRVGARFPDGQLWVDLRGAERQALPPGEALGGLLRALGVDGAVIPDGADERAKLYRTWLADRRVLVVLDNAASERQVRPLLPGAAPSAVLVTSRARLAGLEQTRSVDLDVLPARHGGELLGRIVGPARAAAEPDAVAATVASCGGLPLALRIAGAKLVARPHWTVARLAATLADERRRLDELRVGDLEVRSSVALSYGAAGAGAQRAMRLLGLITVADFAPWVAAALLDIGVQESEDLLERPVEARLLDVARVDATGQVRYRFHDLLRAYARERLEREEPVAVRQAALGRALGAWLALAERADAGLPGVPRVSRGDAARWQPDAAVVDALLADPLVWLEAEHRCLLAAAEQACDAGLDELAWELASTLDVFTELRSHWSDGERLYTSVVRATRAAGNLRGMAHALRGLGEVYLAQERLDLARECLEEALALFELLGERHGQAQAQRSLGDVAVSRGRFEQAVAFYERCVPVLQQLGDRRSEAYALRCLGLTSVYQGRAGEARARFRECVELFRRLGDRRGEAVSLMSLGELDRDHGDLATAVVTLREAGVIFADLGDRRGEGYALRALGRAHARGGTLSEAVACLERCRVAFHGLGDQLGEAHAWQSLAELHQQLGRSDLAVTCYRQALPVFQQRAIRLWEARTQRGLGVALAALADRAAAGALRAALAIFEELGTPEAAGVALLLDQTTRGTLAGQDGARSSRSHPYTPAG